jgi:hypothetical protein
LSQIITRAHIYTIPQIQPFTTSNAQAIILAASFRLPSRSLISRPSGNVDTQSSDRIAHVCSPCIVHRTGNSCRYRCISRTFFVVSQREKYQSKLVSLPCSIPNNMDSPSNFSWLVKVYLPDSSYLLPRSCWMDDAF